MASDRAFLHLQSNTHILPTVAISCLYKSEGHGFAVIGLLVIKPMHLWCYFFFELQQAQNPRTLVAGIVVGLLVLGLRPER
ncbi:hypothetical protein H6G97_34255 [Nostoc flagelliforme FACHB-838]|uniref:Uncharacterized protein n=2 Tax=Nostoc flagelliforme TaxID=1306274 RepID=A0ABR8E140_9NOSO|nr:hypothetical protein [Nostoc flagelliforme FACHB-838]